MLCNNLIKIIIKNVLLLRLHIYTKQQLLLFTPSYLTDKESESKAKGAARPRPEGRGGGAQEQGERPAGTGAAQRHSHTQPPACSSSTLGQRRQGAEGPGLRGGGVEGNRWAEQQEMGLNPGSPRSPSCLPSLMKRINGPHPSLPFLTDPWLKRLLQHLSSIWCPGVTFYTTPDYLPPSGHHPHLVPGAT